MVDEDVPCEDVLAQITLPAEQKKADIGIAMGGVGSDIALDAADIALVDDEVKELPHLIALSSHGWRKESQEYLPDRYPPRHASRP